MSARWWVFVVWAAAFLLSYFFRSANAVIASDLREAFGLDAAQLGMMSSTFFGALAAAQLPIGVALDRWGPRRVVPITMLFGIGGSLLFAFAETFAALTTGRALLGLGFAGVLMGALHALGQWFPTRRFAAVSGLLVGIGTSGALLAGTPLALVAGAWGWRSVFAVGALVTAAVALTIWLATRDAPNAAEERGTAGSDGGLRLVLSDLRIWRIAFLNLFGIATLLSVQGLWAGPYLTDVHGFAPLRVGDLVSAMGLGVVVGYLGLGVLADRVGRARIAFSAALVFAASLLGLALAPSGTPIWGLASLYVAFGAFSSFGVVLFALARELVPDRFVGRAITTVNLVGIAGAMAVQWIMGVLIEMGAGPAGEYGIAAYRSAFLFALALGVIALAFFAPMLRQRPAATQRHDIDEQAGPRPRNTRMERA